MNKIDALVAAINDAVKTNGSKAITGAILQTVLDNMVSTLTQINGLLNVNQVNSKSDAYASAITARSAVPSAQRTEGLVIAYKLSYGWIIEYNIDSSSWTANASWVPLFPTDKPIRIIGFYPSSDSTFWYNTLQVGECAFNTTSNKISRKIASGQFIDVPFTKDAIYVYNEHNLIWDGSTDMTICDKIVNVNILAAHPSAYSSNLNARSAVPERFRKKGLIIQFLHNIDGWHLEQFKGDDVADWTDNTKWGRILNGIDLNEMSGEYLSDTYTFTAGGKIINLTAIVSSGIPGTITQVGEYYISENTLFRVKAISSPMIWSNVVSVPFYAGALYSYNGLLYRWSSDENSLVRYNGASLYLSDFVRCRWYAGTTVGAGLEERTDSRYYSDSYSIVLKVSEGDKYIVSCAGGSEGRAYYMLDENKEVVRMAPASFKGNDILTIEESETFLIVQSNDVKYASIEKIDGDVRENLIMPSDVIPMQDYNFLLSNQGLSELINKKAYDSFRWGIGCKGTVKIGDVEIFASSSTFADMKPITYEDGQIIIEDGCMFFVHTTRGTVCGSDIIKMDVTSYKMEIVGNIVYTNDNQYYTRFTTGSIMYDRNLHLWILTTMLWEADQHMYSGSCNVDPRYGHHIIPVTKINCTQKGYDEDSFIFYDTNPDSPHFQKYVLLNTGTHPNGDGDMDLRLHTCATWNGEYTMQVELDGTGKSYTGPFVQKIGGIPYVFIGTRLPIQVTPNDMSLDEYWVLEYPALNKLGKLNIDSLTGAWGGWGNVMCIPYNNGTKYIFMTFDRSATSSADQWQYGTTYIYEADEFNSGLEYPLESYDGTQIQASPDNIDPLDLTFRKSFARKHYFDMILPLAGFYPNQFTNNQYCNEIELTNAVLTAGEKNIILTSLGESEGYAIMGKNMPMMPFKIVLYNTGGTDMGEIVIANSDFSKYRKFQFEFDINKINIKVRDKLEAAEETTLTLSQNITLKDWCWGVELLVGQYKNGLSIYYKYLK